jgi:hypothetical protein
MPKTPILSRELFYDKLGDGSHRMLDWALVDTSLGAMIESRSAMLGVGLNPVTNVDMVDLGYNRVTQMDEGKFSMKFNTGGGQFPKDISTYENQPIKFPPHST